MNPGPHESTASLLEQYATELGGTPDQFAPVSIGEQARIAGPLAEYRGVEIDLVDESSLMCTSTFKAPLAAVAVADALKKKRSRFVTVSAGNTAEAMAAYAVPHGLECFLFVTGVSHYKLDSRFLNHPLVHLFELDVPEQQLKQIGAEFSRRMEIPLLPAPEHQLTANKLRALYLADEYARGRPCYDWTVQAISGGFGPIGFYQGMEELVVNDRWPADEIPSLLGVQQQGNCPLVHQQSMPDSPRMPIIEPTLYATRPSGAAQLRRIMTHYGGDCVAVSNRSYADREQELLEVLRKHGLPCGRSRFTPGMPLIERSGLLAVLGTLEAIERGIIPPGSRILVCFTGGCAPDLHDPVEPEFRLAAGEPVELFWNAVTGYVGSAGSTIPV